MENNKKSQLIIKEYNSKLNLVDILHFIKLSYGIFMFFNSIFNLHFNSYILQKNRIFWRKSMLYTMERMMFEVFEIVYILYSFYTLYNLFKRKIVDESRSYDKSLLIVYQKVVESNKTPFLVSFIIYGYIVYFLYILYNNISNLINYKRYFVINCFINKIQQMNLEIGNFLQKNHAVSDEDFSKEYSQLRKNYQILLQQFFILRLHETILFRPMFELLIIMRALRYEDDTESQTSSIKQLRQKTNKMLGNDSSLKYEDIKLSHKTIRLLKDMAEKSGKPLQQLKADFRYNVKEHLDKFYEQNEKLDKKNLSNAIDTIYLQFYKELALKDIHDSLSRGKKQQKQINALPMAPTGPTLPVAPIFTHFQSKK